MNPMSHRAQRVCSLIQCELGALLRQTTQWQSLLDGLRFDLAVDKISPDLRIVTIAVLCDLGDQPQCLRLLRDLAPVLQHKLAPRLGLKYVPTLRFVADTRLRQEMEMRALLRSIEKDLSNQHDEATQQDIPLANQNTATKDDLA